MDKVWKILGLIAVLVIVMSVFAGVTSAINERVVNEQVNEPQNDSIQSGYYNQKMYKLQIPADIVHFKLDENAQNDVIKILTQREIDDRIIEAFKS